MLGDGVGRADVMVPRRKIRGARDEERMSIGDKIGFVVM